MIYVLTWTAWACVGAVSVLGFKVSVAQFPEQAKPAMAAVHLCRPDYLEERYDPARREAAFARFRELGAGARLRRCRGVVCKDVPKITTVTVKIDDHPEEGP